MSVDLRNATDLAQLSNQTQPSLQNETNVMLVSKQPQPRVQNSTSLMPITKATQLRLQDATSAVPLSNETQLMLANSSSHEGHDGKALLLAEGSGDNSSLLEVMQDSSFFIFSTGLDEKSATDLESIEQVQWQSAARKTSCVHATAALMTCYKQVTLCCASVARFARRHCKANSWRQRRYRAEPKKRQNPAELNLHSSFCNVHHPFGQPACQQQATAAASMLP